MGDLDFNDKNQLLKKEDSEHFDDDRAAYQLDDRSGSDWRSLGIIGSRSDPKPRVSLVGNKVMADLPDEPMSITDFQAQKDEETTE